MKRLFKGFIGGLLSLGILASAAYAEPSAEADDTAVSDGIMSAGDLVSGESMVYLQNGMRAVTVTPTVDFYTGEQTDASLAEELPALFAELSGYDMNAVVINTDGGDIRCYDLDMTSGRGALGAAIDSAHENGFYAYVQLDVNSLIEEVISGGGGLKAGFSAAAHKFVMKYACEGIILTNYYTADTPEMYAEYMRSGAGIGYQNWLYETNEYVIRTLSEVIRRTSNTTAVGMLITDMWANYTSHEEGSFTADTVQALYDGYCDTRQYLRSGYADFIMVKAYGTDTDAALDFDSVISWWYDLAEETGVKLYTLHLNERIGQYAGWYEDQLLRQLSILEDYPDNGGSCFNSLSALRSDPLGSTGKLLAYFDEQINPDTLFDTLQMTLPEQTNFITYDSTVKFMGTFDENFDVLFDGSKVELNEAGNFYFTKELKVGRNTFVIEHKGKKITYVIDRQVDVLKSIEQTKDIIVEGGSKIILEAVAYRGSKVSAVIGGQTVNLKENTGASEDIDANSDYARFVGSYRAPEGIIGQEQYLGSVSYYANYKGNEEYMTGGSVTVEAEPEPPKEIVVESFVDQSSVGTGEIVGTIAPVVSDSEYVTYIKTLANYTTVYDSQTTGGAPSPVLSQLPAGSLDYYKSASGDYIISTSGRRYLATDVTTFYDTGLGENSLFVKAVGNSGGKSYLKIRLDYRSTFNVTSPVSFVEQEGEPYGVTNYNPDRVEIVFDNVTSVTKLPDFDNCSLFSAGSWDTVEQNGVPKFRLTLTLRQAGIYSGCGAYYDENGDLMLTFDVPTASLSGKVIVIDPGHGYGKTATKLDPGGVGFVTDQAVGLAVSKALEEKLTAMGATVVRLKTESEFILTTTRPSVARSYGADMYLSLHGNSVVANPDAHGVEVYYFTPFSQPLAKSINDNIASYYDNTVYADGTNSNRGDKYSYYWVTLQQDFPSVLVEMGFVTNEREAMVMADPAHQDEIARCIAEGVKSYFARSGLSYSGSASSEAPENPDNGGGTTVPVEPEIPDTPDTPDTPETPDIPQTSEPDIPVDPGTEEAPSVSEETSRTEETSEPELPPETEQTNDTSEASQPDIPVTEEPDYSGGGGIRVE